MPRSTRSLIGVLALLGLSACFQEQCGVEPEPFTFTIDDTVFPSVPTIPGVNGGPPREITVLAAPDGERDEFVANEIMIRPRSDAELEDFLDTYGGVVLHDGTPLVIEGATPRGPLEPTGSYLIRFDPSLSTLDDLPDNMAEWGIGGAFVFSSEDGARLTALLARESERLLIQANTLFSTNVSSEHPDDAGGNIDWELMRWMTEDDNPNQPGDQGLSIGVAEAWRYLRYLNIPPTPEPGVPFTDPRIIVAVIDRGFSLDTSTGVPLGNNVDFGNSFNAPLQSDAENNDNRAGGGVDDGSTLSKQWHGTGTFGICCAAPRNLFGGAGTGGPVVRPMLIRTGLDGHSMHLAIHSAAIMGADVITISMSNQCGTLCDIGDFFTNDLLKNRDGIQSAVFTAVAFGATVLASASNAGVDISDKSVIPCKLDKVICVGSVSGSGRNLDNFGDGVDVWSYGGIYRTTVIPETAANDANDTGLDELLTINATSASTPMVAGVVALMKAVDPSLQWDDIESILQQTANPSDPPVVHGYIDAFRAVESLRPNQPPGVVFNIPSDGSTPSHQREVYLHADVTDPERGPGFRGDVVFSSNVDGELCRTSGFVTGCQGPKLSLGEHTLTATATDPFGATTSDAIVVDVINQIPIAKIVLPETGSSFFADQTINFRGYGFDWDELLEDSSLQWSSDVDGNLDTGKDIAVGLSEGPHTIRLTATDSLGLQGIDEIAVNVLPAGGHPSVTILDPDDGLSVPPGTTITLLAVGTDPEDGDLPPAAFEWLSDVDGSYGTGNPLEITPSGPATPCKPELIQHTIKVRATDSAGNSVEHEIRILVGAIC